jgi:AcrR family transcriptional regulator
MTSSRSRRATRSVYGRALSAVAKPLPKPRKRPVQDRARFTIQAIYGAYVRIWRRDGPDAVTTRAVAEEAGFAIGTLYEYFPNQAALHSGYVRYTIDWLLGEIERQIADGGGEAWPSRLRKLVEASCGAGPDQPFFDVEMLHRIGDIAESWHHQRVFEELAAAWTRAIRAWDDLDPQPSAATLDTLVLLLWGARRYVLLLDRVGDRLDGWVGETERICRVALQARSEG